MYCYVCLISLVFYLNFERVIACLSCYFVRKLLNAIRYQKGNKSNRITSLEYVMYITHCCIYIHIAVLSNEIKLVDGNRVWTRSTFNIKQPLKTSFYKQILLTCTKIKIISKDKIKKVANV